jgi:serine/threonine-protein kinase
MAPEQARAEQAGPASDQYALGMVLAELVTLMPPREGGSTVKQLSLAIAGRPLVLRHRFGEPLPRELVAIVRKATALAPEQRYRSVAELAADVRRFVRDEAVSVLADPPSQRLWRWLKRRPLLVFGTVAASLTLTSALIAVGLYRELLTREEAALRADRIFVLTSAVGRTAHGVDARFRRMELLLEGMTRASAESLRRPSEGSLEPLTPRELARSSLPAWVPRYAQNVSFERSVYVASPGVRPEVLEPVLARLGALEELLVQTSARAAADDEVLARPMARWRELAREGSPVLWADLAFESGVLLVYPGNTFFPPDYDVRKRSWYTAAAGRRGHVWGSPYPDATSGQLLIACSRAFHDAGGKLVGVASVHVRLEDVLGTLVVPDVPGYQGSALLDRNGDVVVSERALDVKLGAGTHENRALKHAPFEVAGARQAVRDGKREGRVIAGQRMVVFRGLDTEGWYLAVTVDAAPYGLR